LILVTKFLTFNGVFYPDDTSSLYALHTLRLDVFILRMEANFVNGVPELLILRFLAEKEMYGYQLVAAIQVGSREAFKFGEGCIYPLLHAMEGKKLLSKRKETVSGRQRCYYRATLRGRKRLEALTEQWSQVQSGVQLILGGRHALA